MKLGSILGGLVMVVALSLPRPSLALVFLPLAVSSNTGMWDALCSIEHVQKSEQYIVTLAMCRAQ